MWVQVKHLEQIVKQAKVLVKNDAFIVSAIPTIQEAPDQYKLVRCRDNTLLYKSRETMLQMIEESQIAVWDTHAEQTESIPKTEVRSCSELMPGDCILLGGIEIAKLDGAKVKVYSASYLVIEDGVLKSVRKTVSEHDTENPCLFDGAICVRYWVREINPVFNLTFPSSVQPKTGTLWKGVEATKEQAEQCQMAKQQEGVIGFVFSEGYVFPLFEGDEIRWRNDVYENMV